MRNMSPALQARLDSQATTLCQCWKILRRDGTCLGFTDHDANITMEEQVFLPEAGLAQASRQDDLGLAVGGTEVSGGLALAGLDETSLANGLFDGASVETWLVDWSDPAHRLLLDVSTIGEVRRGEHAFTAELRSFSHRLDQETGRRFQRACGADLGDAHCGVALDDPAFRAQAYVLRAPSRHSLLLRDLGFPADWLSGGTCLFLSGANAGARMAVKAHLSTQEGALIEFWSPLAQEAAAGDRVEVTAGCDKTFATCKVKFANSKNFRGFPHIPGTEILVTPAGVAEGPMDGRSLFHE